VKAKKTNRLKLTGTARKLASKYIEEEIETGQYPRSQAVAIGISRARREASLKSMLIRLATTTNSIAKKG
jgi:hypothetical protein